MTKYDIEISETAEQQLKKLQRSAQRRVVRAILALADEQHPRRCRKLSGYEDVFRLRVRRYRVIYSVSGNRLIVIILKIGHRKDVYR
jgi:mRNA interferase RelE/StbE